MLAEGKTGARSFILHWARAGTMLEYLESFHRSCDRWKKKTTDDDILFHADNRDVTTSFHQGVRICRKWNF